MARERTSSSTPVWSATDLADDPHHASDKADRVRRMFGAIADRYDLNNRVHSFGRDQAWRRRAVALSGAGPDDRVLDAACGTGDLSEAFADVGAEVHGVDFAEPMIERARRKSADRRRRDGYRAPVYAVADVTSLPLDDETFTVVSIAFGLRNVSDPTVALSEFHRVLRAINRVYCERVMPFTATLIARDRSGAYRYLPRSIATFSDRDQLAGLMADTGFTGVTQHPLTFGVCVVTVGVR